MNKTLPLLLSLSVLLTGCLAPNTPNLLNVSDDGFSTIDAPQLSSALSTIEQEELSDIERDSLIYMRQEEMLAYDIYTVLYDKWGQKSFRNIASSEQSHTESVLQLLNRYTIEDPSSTSSPGEYKNADLQQLYDSLVETGTTSLIDALKVGATVEEVDIIDIENYLKDIDNEDIKVVYENLLRGSRNHLRAYVKNLDKQGVTYSPQYLSQDQYEDIISSSMEKGR